MEQTDRILTMDAIKDAMGPDVEEFMKAMDLVNMIIDDPSAFGPKRAALEAARLAAIRTKIGVKAQYYKTAERSILNTKRKNVLHVLWEGLLENINTLKLLSRYNDIL